MACQPRPLSCRHGVMDIVYMIEREKDSMSLNSQLLSLKRGRRGLSYRGFFLIILYGKARALPEGLWTAVV